MNRRIPIALVAVAAVLGLAAIGGASSIVPPDADAKPAGPPQRIDTFEQAPGPVSAEQLWTHTLDATSCFRDQGLRTIGPVPTADGSNTWYAIEAGSDSLVIEERCTSQLTPLAMRFAIDGSPEQASLLIAIRQGIQDCVVDKGVRIADPPRDGLIDTGLEEAAHSAPEIVHSCAAAAPDPVG